MAFKIPSITSAIPRDLRAFCDRVRELLTGTGPDRIVTRRDLIATGVVVQGPAGTLLPPPPEITFGTPPAPSGLAASGAIANIILTWDAPNYAGHSYTEIFVADTNTFADRVKLADAPGSVFSHSVGAATTKYYWIQFVNLNEVKGPFNSTIGVSGTTGQDPDYLMDVLSDAFGSTSLAPFFQIDVPTTINGVLIPAGTYIKQAFIADATISRAKIQDLAVDNAKIDNLDAVKITTGFLNAARIQAGSIDATKVNFTIVGTTNVVGTINSSSEGIRISGNRIQIDGNVTFSAGYDPTTKIASGGAATDINNNVTTISGGKITTGSITADKLITNDLYTIRIAAGSGGTPGGYKVEITAANVLHVDDFFAQSIMAKDIQLSNNVSFTVVDAINTSSSGTGHALRARNTNASYGSSGLVGPARADFDFYAEGHGAYGPFTGSHDGLISKTVSPTAGDILVDGDVLFRRGVSDATSEVFLSSSENQAALGVYVARHEITDGFYIASAIVGRDDRGNPIPSEAFTAMAETHDVCGVNSVGEGLINVCGESGNISKGDLIVTSSVTGKGMKQSDDIIRSYTVARAREDAVFSGLEVKQIACIYLCG